MNFNLKDYLKKFESILPLESKIKNAVVQSVQELIEIELDRKSIKIQGSNIFIQGSAALKSEISLKQEKILKRIQELRPELNIKKIM